MHPKRLLPPILAVAVLTQCGMPPGSGGAAGGGGGGGSHAAGGGTHSTGTGDNALVSGSRLKAVVTRGSDGSKAPYMVGTYGMFWDTQLKTYCQALGFANACIPVRA